MQTNQMKQGQRTEIVSASQGVVRQDQEIEQNQQQIPRSNFGYLCKLITISFISFFIFGNILTLIMQSRKSYPPLQNYKHMQLQKGLLYNRIVPQQTFNISLYMIKKDKQMSLDLRQKIWSITNAPYEKGFYRQFNLTLPIKDILKKNAKQINNSTLLQNVKLQCQIDFLDYFSQGQRPSSIKILSSNQLSLLVFKPDKIQQEHSLLFDDQMVSVVQEDVKKSNKNKDQKYIPHIKPWFDILFTFDNNQYPIQGIPNVEIKRLRGLNYHYIPSFEFNQFWLHPRDHIRLNSTDDQITIQIGFNVFNFYYLQIMRQVKLSLDLYKKMGLEMMKFQQFQDMVIGTNIILLIVTMIVSILHGIFQCLSIKNEIQFWRNKSQFRGISLRILFVQLVMKLIILLYLFDSKQQTNRIILFSFCVEILVNLWKIRQAMICKQKASFPFVQFINRDGDSMSNDDDVKSTKWLIYVLIPLMIGTGVYNLIYNSYTSWYSFVIRTLALGVYTFGFFLMFPQVYLNYKLKSVEHLPWRMLIYRFLNTIIDDLFAFVITMPTMHMVACFRDDVIFVIFLIQMCLYRKNPRRKEALSDKEKVQ